MITFKQFLFEDEPLTELRLVLALVKELEISKEEAQETLDWLRDEDDADLPDEAYNAMTALFDDKLRAANAPPHEDVSAFLQQWMTLHLKKRYKLDTGWSV